jgi:hypothetical protein
VPPRRTTRLDQFPALIGPDALVIDEPGNGWPALCRVRGQDSEIPIALHLGVVKRTFRKRDDIERRIQNPGKEKPVQAPLGHLALIVGVWDEVAPPILVAFDASRRVGQVTRKSMFVKLAQLKQAAVLGWAEGKSASGEAIYAFTPPMLPAYVEMVRHGVELPTLAVSNVLAAAGVTSESQGASPIERARRATSMLVRNARFGRKVVDAYEGLCALCGIDSGLVEGAHIYPAEAPESPDEDWNGLALCANHHSAFDRHLIWIAPEDHRVKVHPNLHSAAVSNTACASFIAATFQHLRRHTTGDGPRAEMFRRRYDFYDGSYSWGNEEPQ